MSDVVGTFGTSWRETVVIRNGTWMIGLTVNTPLFGLDNSVLLGWVVWQKMPGDFYAFGAGPGQR